ncbi:MAG: Ig-like domain-containing protein, partial [Candidatus Thorarchaeota archaeon]
MLKKGRVCILIVSLGFILFLIGTTPIVTPAADVGGMSLSPNATITGLELDSMPGVFTPSFTPGNNPPIAMDDAYTTDEDTVLIIDAILGVLANDTDPDEDLLASQLVTAPLHGSLDFNVDGSFTYTPDPDWYGIDFFVYEALDGMLTDTATVTITVNRANTRPVAGSDLYATDEDTVLQVDFATGVLSNDVDIDGDPLSAMLVSGPSHGSLEFNADGSFTYTPDPDWYGIDSFMYHVSDGELYDEGPVTIEVTSVNDAPVAEDDVYFTDEDVPLGVSSPGVLENDYDVEGSYLEAHLVTDASNGILTFFSDGSFAYEPYPEFYGTDSFSYTAFDGEFDSNIATVTIAINSVNDAPVAVDDYVVTDEDTPIIIDYMANDYDIEGNALSRSWVSWHPTEIHGQWVYVWHEVEPGVFRWTIQYTPDPNWHGTITPLRYGIRDSLGAESNAAYIYITVNPMNDAPVAVDDTYTTNEDTILQTDVTPGVLANDTDIEGDALQAVLETGPSNGVLTLNADGSFAYTPDADFWGTDSFSYRASDGLLQSNIATVTITILPVDDPSVAIDDYVTTDEDTPIIIDVMANDYDIEGDAFNIFGYGWSPPQPYGQL